MSVKWVRRNVVGTLILAAFLILFILRFDQVGSFLGALYSVLLPVLFGGIFAFILNLPMVKIEKMYFPKRSDAWVLKTRRPVAIFASLAIIILFMAVLLILIIPQLSQAVRTVVQVFPYWADQTWLWLKAFAEQEPEQMNRIQEQIASQGESIWRNFLNQSGNWASGVLSASAGILAFFVNTALGLVIAVYILADKEHLKIQWDKLCAAYLPDKAERAVQMVLSIANETFSKYIVGQSLDALILGILCFIGMHLFGFPYAAMIASVVGVTNIVPIVGPYVGAFIGAFVILTEDPMKAVLFVVFVIVLQQIDGNLIMPRVVGNSVGLPALWVLVAILVVGGLFGVVGVLFAVPLASTFYKLLRLSVNERLAVESKISGPEPDIEENMK